MNNLEKKKRGRKCGSKDGINEKRLMFFLNKQKPKSEEKIKK